MAKKYNRHLKIWVLLIKLLGGWIKRLFNVSPEQIEADGACIIISNHVTSWDPLIAALSMRNKHAYFVASEHIFRLGIITKLLNWLLEPIARKKATVGTDTVKNILRHIKAGHSVFIFGEGEATWTGANSPLVQSTGKLIKLSGASLVTFRIEGGYLAKPRWTSGIRHGSVHAHPVAVYTPDMLKNMTPQEINALIERDTYENAWERQRTENQPFKGKRLAEGIEKALFLCPKCQGISTVRGEGDRIKCTCGLDILYKENGLFAPPVPFENALEWDKWQHEQFRKHSRNFSDDFAVILRKIEVHGETQLSKGKIAVEGGILSAGEYSFALNDISSMAMVQTRRLLFSHGEDYYELFTKAPVCLRKYLAAWESR